MAKIKGRKKNREGKKRATTRRGRQPYDPGTLPALLKKAALLRAIVQWDGYIARFVSIMDRKEIDSKYAEYPLGILFARRLITEQEHDAGIALAKTRKVSGIARPPLKISSLQEYIDSGTSPTRYDEDKAIRAMDRYKTACRIMTPAQRDEVLNVCCHDTLPHWADNIKPEITGLQDLKAGLNCLVNYFMWGDK